MRTDITERFYRTFTYQDVDRVPDVEDGFWPQTLRRWLKEGLDLELTPDEILLKTSPKLDAFFWLRDRGMVPADKHADQSTLRRADHRGEGIRHRYAGWERDRIRELSQYCR